VLVDGEAVGDLPGEVLEVNAAVAVGISLALGMDTGQIAARLGGLIGTEHRQALTRTERGITIIDDTYNSNPAGVASALDLLDGLAGDGRKVVVTPGMVELGPLQREENVTFARRAAGEADALVIVGRTNRAALLEGSAKGKATVTVVDTRDEAVTWVRENLGEGDTVLYENDLPDHYP
jgi:UDP-N-acetylmuramoyl-tripeptide--D-alanyl-D-alanine ligase